MRDGITNLEVKPDVLAEDERFQLAMSQILNMVPKNSPEDRQHLFRSWLELTGASWAWLWISHQDGHAEDRWEVLYVFSSEGNHGNYAPGRRKLSVTMEGTGKKQPVVQYCSDFEKPILIDKPAEWEFEKNGLIYSVLGHQDLTKYGCQSFLTVPLVFPRSEGSAGAYSVLSDMKGALCLHFSEKSPPKPLLSEAEYLLLARATASAFAHSFAAAQFKLLHDLHSLAAEYLTKFGLNPTERRNEYLKKVIELIKTHLHVSYVTIFYQTKDKERVECIATTGIECDDIELPQDQLASAWYKKGEHRTGKVYETGLPFVYQGTGKCPPSEGESKQWREVPGNIPDSDRAWVVWPICTPVTPGTGQKGEVLGVIHCVDNRAPHNDDEKRPFDPMQLQTLDFIAEQLAPVLDTMAASIWRDQTINFVKHDLYAPLRVIDDEAQKLQDYLDGRDRKIDYIPKNIRASVVMAKNLAGSLSEQIAFTPEPTYLEGDIIARLKDGLGQFAWVENGMKIKYKGLRDNNIPRLMVDRNLIERVVCNLLINAIKYGFEDTEINVVGEVRNEGFVVLVENYGIGIDSGDRMRIFDGIYRSEKAKERNLGLGLGLKIARETMRRHGGDLRLEQLYNPTVFAMIFPKSLAVNY